MDLVAVRTLFDEQQRRHYHAHDLQRVAWPTATDPQVVRYLQAPPGKNFILYSALTAADADAVIAAQVAALQPLGQPFEWKVYDYDTPPDLIARLAAHGFTQEEPEAVMVLALDEVNPALLAPPTVEVRRLTQRAELAQVIAIETQVWGSDFSWMTRRMGDHLETPGYLSVYVAYVDGVPACAAWIYFYPQSVFAGLWGGSTLPAYRQRGLYTALLAVRVQAALQRGYRFLCIDASPMSRPIVAKYGFEVLGYATECNGPTASVGR